MLFFVLSWTKNKKAVSTWFIDIIIKVMGILITIVLYSRMISIYLHCAVAPLPMVTVTNHHMSNIGIGYMKNVFALAMQAVLMMICVAIYGVLVANVFDPNTIALDPANGVTAIKLLTKACWSTVGISILLVYTMFKCEGITKQIFAIS